ncbi:hypothetical protein A2415_04210 [candidate division WWE3 bacterium RIFOXYC1_FULL_39_7]|uniref:DUF192 domain-containing protein n=2 Tax=Katanobacteria TaxID=422282 RepID=A0A1F4X7G2_UNCKA|nr:MAG: hypothetical protein A2415_04210 [candidate division WWE3 bacterium RIFOXYC1_FULL_39_7]OGC77655.1 MAG: hypothetical protein A2619_05465 [candidate division WWE3 bacterium RIFOXYD1_FULL_39_9]
MKNKRALAALFFTPIILLVFLAILNNKPEASHNIASLIVSGVEVTAEIADSPSEKMQGLMFRKTLGENEGMFFIYENEDYYSYWMKNTFIPLDLIWLDSDYTVVDIKTNAPPCLEETCPSYKPATPARYVLELNAGWSEKNSLKIGDKIEKK